MEAPRLEVQLDVTAREWQVEKGALVPAVHPRRVFAQGLNAVAERTVI